MSDRAHNCDPQLSTIPPIGGREYGLRRSRYEGGIGGRFAPGADLGLDVRRVRRDAPASLGGVVDHPSMAALVHEGAIAGPSTVTAVDPGLP